MVGCRYGAILAGIFIARTAFGSSLEESAAASPSASVNLTKENFDRLTKGKTVFIKFFVPQCEHSKALAPAWEKLAKLWKDDPMRLIGEVDCSVERTMCEKDFTLTGFPSLLYGEPSYGGIFLEETGVEKSFESLSKFATKSLVPICTPGNLDACDEETRTKIVEFQQLSKHDLTRRINELEDRLLSNEKQQKTEFAELQQKYDSLQSDKVMTVAKSKRKIREIEAVMAWKAQ